MNLLPCAAIGYVLIRHILGKVRQGKEYKPKASNQWIGGTVYIRVPSDRLEDFLRRVFVDSTGFLAGKQMHYFQVSKVASDRYGNYRTVTEKSLQQLLNQCLAGGLDTIYFQDRKEDLSDRFDQPHAGWGVDVHPSDIFGNTHRLMFKMPLELLDQPRLHSYLQSIISEFEANYGGIYIGTLDYVESLMHTTLHLSIHDTPFPGGDEDTDKRMLKFAKEIEFYGIHLEQFRNSVPRAEWGNILSPVHISALGGEERIRQESCCEFIELWGNNLYIQLTASPRQYSVDDIIRLNDYFRSIRLSDAPEPLYI